MVRIQFPGNPESQGYPEDTENLAQFLICSMWRLPYLPVYKSTFQDLKISPKIRPRLIHGSKLEIQAPVK